MPLVVIVLVAVVLTAVWITANVYRYRTDVFQHWYGLGQRDAWNGVMNYTPPSPSNQFIVNAYWAGYNDHKTGVNKWR